MKTAFVLSALLAAASLSACDSSLPAHRTRVAARARDAGSAAPARVGREVFRMNCQGCHAAGGVGSARAPSLARMGAALAGGAGDAIVRARLANGGREMPSFSHLSRPEVDAVVGFLVELGGGRARPEPPVAPLAGAALGEHLYRSNCAGCHGEERTVTTGISCRPANLAGATQRFTKQQVMNLLNVGTGPMPAFTHLKDSERDAIWTYLDTLEAGPNAPTGASCGMVRAAMDGRAAPAGGGGGGCGCGGGAPAAPSAGAPAAAAAGGCGGGGGGGCGGGCGGSAPRPAGTR